MTPLGLAALGLVVVGGLVALDRIANSVVRPVPIPPDGSLADTGLAYEEVTIPSGGHDLAAWVVRGGGAATERPVLLLAHGWGASHATVLRLAEPLARAGHDVLLFDVRGHGRNRPAPYVTVRHFRDDVMAAAAFVAKREPSRSIVLIGHSFGGAAGVLAAAEGSQIHGLALIATPADVLRITAEFLTDQGMPGAVMVTLLRPFWWRRVGGSFLPHTPERRIPEVHVPMLILQPEHDQRVARDHAERLSAASGVPYRLIPDRGHTDVLDAPLTHRLVEDFVAGLSSVDRTGAASRTP